MQTLPQLSRSHSWRTCLFQGLQPGGPNETLCTNAKVQSMNVLQRWEASSCLNPLTSLMLRRAVTCWNRTTPEILQNYEGSTVLSPSSERLLISTHSTGLSASKR